MSFNVDVELRGLILTKQIRGTKSEDEALQNCGH